MANNKKSFILYCDSKELVKKMSDESAGKLFKHIFSYVSDENPETDDPFVELAFEHFKQFLKRDLEKYENYIEKQRLNGKKGGRPKKPQEPKITQPFLNKPKKADSDNVNDSVSDNVNVSENKTYYLTCLKDLVWVEACARNKKTDIQTINNFLEAFLDWLELKEDYKPNIQGFKSHFINWLNRKEIKPVNKSNPHNISF